MEWCLPSPAEPSLGSGSDPEALRFTLFHQGTQCGLNCIGRVQLSLQYGCPHEAMEGPSRTVWERLILQILQTALRAQLRWWGPKALLSVWPIHAWGALQPPKRAIGSLPDPIPKLSMSTEHVEGIPRAANRKELRIMIRNLCFWSNRIHCFDWCHKYHNHRSPHGHQLLEFKTYSFITRVRFKSMPLIIFANIQIQSIPKIKTLQLLKTRREVLM